MPEGEMRLFALKFRVFHQAAGEKVSHPESLSLVLVSH
jgi:hypothetical protein